MLRGGCDRSDGVCAVCLGHSQFTHCKQKDEREERRSDANGRKPSSAVGGALRLLHQRRHRCCGSNRSLRPTSSNLRHTKARSDDFEDVDQDQAAALPSGWCCSGIPPLSGETGTCSGRTGARLRPVQSLAHSYDTKVGFFSLRNTSSVVIPHFPAVLCSVT